MGGWLSSGPTYAFCILLLSCHVWMSQISSCLFMPASSKESPNEQWSDTADLGLHARIQLLLPFKYTNTRLLIWDNTPAVSYFRVRDTGTRVIRSSSLHIWKDKQTQSASKGVPEKSQCRKGQIKPGLFTIVVFSPFLSISGWCSGFWLGGQWAGNLCQAGKGYKAKALKHTALHPLFQPTPI